MPQAYTFLADVKPFKTSWKVHVRVLHTWKTYTTLFGETFDMVLVDIQGTKIHASVKKDLINRFTHKITPGKWRSIENFGLSFASGQFKPTSHKYKMSFMTQTSVNRLDDLSDDPYLSLSRFDSVLSGDLNPNYLIDIVGQIVNVGEMETIDVNNKPTNKIDFELRDENDVRLKCTLWGSFADQIYAVCEDVGSEIVICLLRFAKIKIYNDFRTISNAFNASVLNLFAMMLLDSCLSRPEHVWEKTWQILSEDIENKKKEQFNNPGLNLTDGEKKNYTLQEIEEIMLSNGGTLKAFDDMPKPTDVGVDHSNRLFREEKNYNRTLLKEKHDDWIQMMTSEQKTIYDEIMGAVLEDNGGVFFVYGFGGTGKTFLWKTLSAAVRYRGFIAINVASSGIASLLLEGGRTAHSRFCIPIHPDDFTMCNINPTSDLASMLKEASLIIWDEAPMMSRYCFENLDRSLSDIMRNTDNKPFGGKVVVFGGDFRQVLPVINGAGRAQIVMASLNSSYLWQHCKVLTLTKNMRLMAKGVSEIEARSIKEFSDWILAVGDGKICEPNDGEALIDIPHEFLITSVNDPIDAISRAVYGDLELLHKKNDPKFFQKRAILCPTNSDVHTINERLLEKLQGEEMVYLSADSIDPQDSESLNNPMFSSEFLNSIRLSGLPNHSLRLKIGAPVMLLRNIDPKGGLCNGTRLQITQLGNNVLEACVITGDRVGHKVLIPKVLIKPSDTKLPFRMRRRQFPLAVAFAMTINKSQGQSLEEVGLFLPRHVFSHGQLYVALSRVTSKKGLKVLIVDEEGVPKTKTMNVVFKEIFQNIWN